MPKRVLLIEDDPLDAELIRTRLTKAMPGSDIQTVGDTAGLERVLGGPGFDLIFCDNTIPSPDGGSTIAYAIKRCPRTPCVGLSGVADEVRVRQAIGHGAFDYVSKSDLWRLPMIVRDAELAVAGGVRDDRVRAMSRLVQAVKDLGHCRQLDEITAIVRRAARDLVGADGATFVLRDGDQCFYADEDAIEPLWKGMRFPSKACISGWAMANRAQVSIPDIYQDERIPVSAYRPTFVKSLVMTPVRREDPLAAIGTYWAKEHQADAGEQDLLQVLADTTAVAIDNVQLLNGLEQRVTERTRQLSGINAELGAFSYSLAHDLRAPLRAIQGFAELVQEDAGDQLPAECRQHLARIARAGERMNTMIDTMLGLFRLAAKTPRSDKVDLADLADEVVTLLRAGSPGRTVEVVIERPLAVRTDRDLLRTVLENLIGNAWKFTGKTPAASIKVTRERLADGGEAYVVGDNGAGFSLAQANQLFAPFQRYHSDTDFPGTGVGLATVRRAVHHLGGRIWAESEPGKGARFFFTLPAGEEE